MALAAMSGDEQGVLFTQLCNVLELGVAVALSSVSNGLRTATLPLLPQLRANHEVAISTRLLPAGREKMGQMELVQQFAKQMLSRLEAAGADGSWSAPGVLLWVGRPVLRPGLPSERASSAG